MKLQEDIEKRLAKLRKRYRLRYVQERVGRHYLNCVHNYRHAPNPLPYSRADTGTAPERLSTKPRVSLSVVQEQSIHICMYGSQDPTKEWNGDLCDELDKRAPDCPWFKPTRTEDEVGMEFDEAMADVEFVFENYKDIAALQWVLDIRDSSDIPEEPPPPPALPPTPPTLWQRIVAWWRGAPASPPQLPPAAEEEEPVTQPLPPEPVTEPEPEVPKGLWDADPKDPST